MRGGRGRRKGGREESRDGGERENERGTRVKKRGREGSYKRGKKCREGEHKKEVKESTKDFFLLQKETLRKKKSTQNDQICE